MCMTVELTIFYSLNCCIRIILYFMLLFFYFSSRFIYSCVLSSVFYTINHLIFVWYHELTLTSGYQDHNH